MNQHLQLLVSFSLSFILEWQLKVSRNGVPTDSGKGTRRAEQGTAALKRLRQLQHFSPTSAPLDSPLRNPPSCPAPGMSPIILEAGRWDSSGAASVRNLFLPRRSALSQQHGGCNPTWPWLSSSWKPGWNHSSLGVWWAWSVVAIAVAGPVHAGKRGHGHGLWPVEWPAR